MSRVLARRGEGRGVRSPPLVLLSCLALSLAGCQLVGISSEPSSPGVTEVHGQPTEPMPQGNFSGFLEIEGGRLDGTLTLTPRGGTELEGFFEAPPDMFAAGRGRYRDGELKLELTYEGACPGKMTLVGKWQEGPGTLSGSVRAKDCTGEAEGTFLFSP